MEREIVKPQEDKVQGNGNNNISLNNKNKNIQNKQDMKMTPNSDITTPDFLSEENIFGIKEDDLDRILNRLSHYISSIDFSSLKSVQNILEKFSEIERNINFYIETLTFLKIKQSRLFKLLINEMLEQKFKEKENKYLSKIQSILEEVYEKVINSDVKRSNFENYFDLLNSANDFSNNNADNTLEKIHKTFDEITNTINAIYLSDVETRIKTNKIPLFLTKIYRKKIKRKVKLACNPLIREHFNILMDNKIEVTTLKSYFALYSQNKLNLFDINYLGSVMLQTLYKIFIISNVEYLNSDKIAMNIFLQRFEEYITIIQLKEIYKNKDLYKNKYSNSDISETYFANAKIEENISTYFDLPLSEREDILKCKIDLLSEMLKDDIEKYFFIIFSFSLMLNNIVKIESHGSISILNDVLVCNSRERQFLSNMLKALKNYISINSHYDPFEINSYSQSIVINNILKTQCVDLFDSHLNMKENLSIDIIDNTIVEKCENDEVLESYVELMNSHGYTGGDASKSSKLKTYLASMMRLLDYNSKDHHINLSPFSITPFDSFHLSTNACICISGFTSDGMDQEMAWENFTVDLNKFTDFYFLNWPSETVTSFLKDILLFIGGQILNVVTENYVKLITDLHGYSRVSNAFLRAKKTAKVCGKLLAHIIASKTFYKFQTFNLVAFSLGTHLIKHCIKELYRLSCKEVCNSDYRKSNSKHNPPYINARSNLENIIQNVVLVAGATTFKNTEKWSKIFDTMVAGRVINCHGKNDNILKFLFKVTTFNDAIGKTAIKMNSNKVENYDFSDLNIDHHEYRKSLYAIFKRINLN